MFYSAIWMLKHFVDKISSFCMEIEETPLQIIRFDDFFLLSF